MDPKHRDRIAFFRVCSGRYAPAMKVQHQRLGREIKLGNVMTFMANERVASEDAVRRRHHRHPQPRPDADRRHADRRRSARVQGHSVFRAGALPRRAPARPVQGQAAAEGLAAAGRGRRDPGVRDPRRQHAAAGRGGPAAVRSGRGAACQRIQGRRDLRRRGHRDRALAHLSRREGAPRLRARSRGIARHRRRRQPRVPRAEPLQPAGGDGALAAGRLPRDARARAADGARRSGTHGRPDHAGSGAGRRTEAHVEGEGTSPTRTSRAPSR